MMEGSRQETMLFDVAVLAQRLETDDHETLRRFYDGYLAHTSSQLITLHNLDLPRERDQFRFIVHQLKSSSASVGAMRLAALFSESERIIVHGNSAELDRCRQALLDCWAATVPLISQYLESPV